MDELQSMAGGCKNESMEHPALQDPSSSPATTVAQARARFHEYDQRQVWIEGEINAGRGTPALSAELAIVSAYADTAFRQLDALGGLEPPVDEAG
jgi:hypothetical protein